MQLTETITDNTQNLARAFIKIVDKQELRIDSAKLTLLSFQKKLIELTNKDGSLRIKLMKGQQELTEKEIIDLTDCMDDLKEFGSICKGIVSESPDLKDKILKYFGPDHELTDKWDLSKIKIEDLLEIERTMTHIQQQISNQYLYKSNELSEIGQNLQLLVYIAMFADLDGFTNSTIKNQKTQ